MVWCFFLNHNTKPEVGGHLRMQNQGIVWKPCKTCVAVKHTYVMPHPVGHNHLYPWEPLRSIIVQTTNTEDL